MEIFISGKPLKINLNFITSQGVEFQFKPIAVPYKVLVFVRMEFGNNPNYYYKGYHSYYYYVRVGKTSIEN